MTAVVVSCEHGGNQVPSEWQPLFTAHQELLASHRGWDPGAGELATTIAARLGVEPLVYSVTRLLIEVNRSIGHPRLFSAITGALEPSMQARLVAEFYQPHRERVTGAVAAAIERHGRVLHLGIHTFTPVLGGRPRSIDVASLDDPRRTHERNWTNTFLAALAERRPELRLARNRPYRGWSDGLTTSLRAQFDGDHYLGIELEVSQAFPLGPAGAWRRLRDDITAAIASSY